MASNFQGLIFTGLYNTLVIWYKNNSQALLKNISISTKYSLRDTLSTKNETNSFTLLGWLETCLLAVSL